MPSRNLFIPAIFAAALMALPLGAQETSKRYANARVAIAGGYSLFSSGFAGADGDAPNNRPLNGFFFAPSLRVIFGLSLKADFSFYRGSASYGSFNAPQHPFFHLYGAQYAFRIRRVVPFVEAFKGQRILNGDYSAGVDKTVTYKNSAFAVGAGLDYPIRPHLGVRLSGDYVRADGTPHSNQFHTGFPTDFTRYSLGLVVPFGHW